MNLAVDMLNDLRQHLALAEEILSAFENESQKLRQAGERDHAECVQFRQGLLPRLNASLDKLKRHRLSWQQLSTGARAHCPEAARLLRQNQDVIMKTIVLDRENEQALLRRGLVPPGHLPPVNRQRPHFVADMYRRQSRG
ncbi:MAG: hypothetical protein HY043_13385 [Verrucomicrobia bacterium]|nr:hypothetical protein [Verrucomicrobiota bacterium]